MKTFFFITTVLFVSFTAQAIEVNDTVSAEAFAACDTGDAANDYRCFVQYVSVSSARSCNGKGRWRIPEGSECAPGMTCQRQGDGPVLVCRRRN